MNTISKATKAIKKNPLIAYFALWLTSSIVMYLMGRLFYRIVGYIGVTFNISSSSSLVLGAVAAIIIMVVKERKRNKRDFDFKALVIPFAILMVSISGILEVFTGIVWYFMIQRYTPLVGSILLGAGITGAIMTWLILSDKRNEETT